MKKVGIITKYYNNRNYGGLLQAYALVKTVSRLGYEVEQICWKHLWKNGTKLKKKRVFKVKRIFHYIKRIFYITLEKRLKNKVALRNSAFTEFQEKIPHSTVVYERYNIKDSVKVYDAFITGSDQVWNMEWYNQEYFLDFVPEGVGKVSYAASMPNVNMSDEKKNLVKNYLESFNNISVREEESSLFLTQLTGREVHWVIDPTLLLEGNDWDEICDKRIMEGDYIFCYFLGKDKNMRKIAKKFSRKTGMKIVTLPHLTGICDADIFFGDVKLYDLSPEKFISLIKYAQYVITDSFHAVVFSNIYKTKYYVFNRTDASEMTTRITSILSLFGCEERFCCKERMNAEYMLEMKDKAVSGDAPKFVKMKENSMEFLRRACL